MAHARAVLKLNEYEAKPFILSASACRKSNRGQRLFVKLHVGHYNRREFTLPTIIVVNVVCTVV